MATQIFIIKAYLYAWDLINLHPSGPALYTSDFFFVAAFTVGRTAFQVFACQSRLGRSMSSS